MEIHCENGPTEVRFTMFEQGSKGGDKTHFKITLTLYFTYSILQHFQSHQPQKKKVEGEMGEAKV